MRRLWLVALLVGSVSSVSVSGQEQERYSIQLREPGKGSLLSSEFNIRTSFALEARNLAGQLVKDDLNVFGAHFASDVTLLEVSPKSNRNRTHYRTFRVITNGETKVEAAEGKTFLILDKDGKKEVLTEKGEPLLPEERQKMEQAISQQESFGTAQEDLTPPMPVRVGDVWPIANVSTWIKREDAEITFTRATAQLQRVYRKEGRLFGVIDLRAEGAVKSITAQGRKMALKPGSRLVLKSTLEGCIDGSAATRTETMSLLASMVLITPTPDGGKATMTQSWEMTGNKTIR